MSKEKKSIKRIKKAEKINYLTGHYFDCHLVTCGNCGKIFNQLINQTKSDALITCPHCNLCDDPCHFPDLFH